MIDHTGVSVGDLARSAGFYRAALAPIGYALLPRFPAAARRQRGRRLWCASAA